MIQWFFFFFSYCFFGWCFESTFVSIVQKEPVNRGFIKGPFLPLYGIGAIMMLLVSMPFQGRPVLVYITGCIGATILEFVTGVAMEALFKVRYWDYSHCRMNFRGYICLHSTLAWGLLTILMTGVAHRIVERFVFAIPGNILTAVTLLLTAYICGDFALSFKAAMDLRDILAMIERARHELQLMQKRLDVMLAVISEEISMKKNEISCKVDQFAGKIERFTGKRDLIASKKDRISGKISESFEEMMTGIEEKIERIKHMLRTKPAGYWKEITGERFSFEELGDMVKKYYRIAIDPERYRRLKEFYQKRILGANPTLSSSEFKEALEELKGKGDKKD
jgi:uncharacterized membrane protein